VSIHVLDDCSLRNIFYLYRPGIFDGAKDDDMLLAGGLKWDRERWWYKLTQVCQRWRNVIFGSATYLGLCLVCTFGTPVKDMLAHSPPFQLIIDYDNESFENIDITAEDEDGILHALGQRDRVRRVRLWLPIPNMQKLIPAMDGEYPVLEYLIMSYVTPWDETPEFVLPETLQAPSLRHLMPWYLGLPIGSRLLTTATGLVTLALVVSQPATDFQPNTLLQWISFMPRLETLSIIAYFVGPNDVERQLMHAPIVTLPNLRWFDFRGSSPYMEAVVRGITTPCLEKLNLRLLSFNRPSVPCLRQLINTTDGLRFDSAKIMFNRNEVHLKVYPPEETEMYALSIIFDVCAHLDQVPCMAQILIFNSLDQVFSTVEHLTLNKEERDRSSEVGPTEWRRLLSSFSNVKTLRVDYGLVKELSRCLRLDDGELSVDLLPELQELTYNAGDEFTSFINARQNAGRPVSLVRIPYL
jgi:hypothetical protein